MVTFRSGNRSISLSIVNMAASFRAQLLLALLAVWALDRNRNPRHLSAGPGLLRRIRHALPWDCRTIRAALGYLVEEGYLQEGYLERRAFDLAGGNCIMELSVRFLLVQQRSFPSGVKHETSHQVRK